jgi:adenylate kinase family enzyme
MEKGKLVPDEITIKMVLERILAADCSGGVIFDGFPRTLKQAEALDKALGEQGKAVDKVVYIKVSEPELLKRLSGRWICRQCQTPYHAVNSPPRVWGKCDRCGGELYQRPDDTVETVKSSVPHYLHPPVGEAYAHIEAPKGELGFYLVSDTSIAPYRCHIRAPSLINLTALRDMAIGWKIQDLIIIFGSIDITMGEVDR